MIKLKPLWQTPDEQLKNIGWQWMLGTDTLVYLANDVVEISDSEAHTYKNACDELYEMFVQAAQYVIDNELFTDLGINKDLVNMIKSTWEDDRHLHLYGRFDLSGGTDGKPIKLIEFNSDTATSIPETAVVQWAHLKANLLSETMQFNGLFESLRENFTRLRELNEDLEPTLLLTTMRDFPEDDTNVAVLTEAARDAGFYVEHAYIDDIDFSAKEGIYTQKEGGIYYQHRFWFKLVPWEFIADDEPELLEILNEIVDTRKAVIINPAYVLLFQSKYILKILWDLFPNHPLLLETSDKPLINKEFQVEKVLFGREGANVRILDNQGQSVREQEGEYGAYPKVYQEYVDFLQDFQGNCYQAGVFFAYGACALGFRRGGRILNNTAQFCGHLIG